MTAVLLAECQSTPERPAVPVETRPESLQVALAGPIEGILSDYQRKDAPGVVVGVIRDGTALYSKGHGMADLEAGIPLTADSVFDIASVAKQFTGMAIAMLIEEGSVSLDESITHYLDNLPAFCEAIKVRHLLDHSSGLRDWPGALILGGLRLEDSISLDDVLSFVRNQESGNFSPGDDSLYSSTGYNLLAQIVEEVSGETFTDWIDRRLFEPLRMNHSFFHDDTRRIIPQRVHSYFGSREKGFRNLGNQLTAVGSSSLYATMNDLLKWMDHLGDPKLVTKGALFDLLVDESSVENERIEYEFGFMVGSYRGSKQLFHGGAWAGFQTFVVYFPKLKLGVAVLTNLVSTKAENIAYQVVDLFLADGFPPRKISNNVPKFESLKPGNVTVSATGKWTGEYQTDDPENKRLRFVELNGSPVIEIDSRTPITLAAETELSYFNKEEYVYVEFSTEFVGWPRIVNLTSGSSKITATEVFETTSDYLHAFEGVYFSNELKTHYRIETDADQLVAVHHRLGPTRFEPTGKDQFISKTWFWKQVEFKRDSRGKVFSLEVTQSKNRKIVFSKQTR